MIQPTYNQMKADIDCGYTHSQLCGKYQAHATSVRRWCIEYKLKPAIEDRSVDSETYSLTEEVPFWNGNCLELVTLGDMLRAGKLYLQMIGGRKWAVVKGTKTGWKLTDEAYAVGQAIYKNLLTV